MRVLKKILYVLGGLFACLCIFVLVCAFNPDLTEKLADAIDGVQTAYRNDGPPGTSADNLNLSGEGAEPENENGTVETVQNDEKIEVYPAEMEEGYDENGLHNPYPEQKQYVVTDEELQIPQKAVGKNGYLPVAESLTGWTGQSVAADYGDTGENLTFDTLYYPYYGMLSETLQKVYRQVYANALALKDVFAPVENLTAAQMKSVMEAVYNDHPELFWLDTAYSCRYSPQGACVEVTLEFNRIADRLEDCRREFTAVANDIIAGAVNYTTDFEKERYVHDALLGRVEYNLAAELNQSAYSALVKGETVCAGYARAFQYVMQQLGIPCYYCTGYAGENHAWNIVKLGNSYYNVDVTWDDIRPASYEYFNQTDKVFSKDHVRNGLSVYLPACTGQKYQEETAGRKPNTWQNSSGNETDNSGEEFLPAVSMGDGVSYNGEVLTSLKDYYANCYSQLSKGGKAIIKFQNVVDSDTLEAIYEAYDKAAYYEGYMDRIKKELDARTCKVSIQITGLEEGKYILSHTVEIY